MIEKENGSGRKTETGGEARAVRPERGQQGTQRAGRPKRGQQGTQRTDRSKKRAQGALSADNPKERTGGAQGLTRSERKQRGPRAGSPQRGSRRGRVRLIAAAALVVLVAGGAVLYRVKKHESIPASLVTFQEKYPEASEFVEHYPGRKLSDPESIDISGEVTQGVIPLFLQWDERWGYETYGSDFLAVTGCGPTCISMVYCGLTGDDSWNPYRVAKYSEEQGYYVKGEGTSWELMTEGAQQLGLSASYGTVSADYLYSELWAGNPLICSMYPGDFTYTGHFIVLTGVDEEGKILVNDPNSPKNSSTHWKMDVLLPQIRSVWVYTW